MSATAPCKRPKVTIDQHPGGQPDAKVVTCHVPRCSWSYPADLQFIALVSDATEQARRHRTAHREAVPVAFVQRDIEWDVHCQPCGGHRRTFGTKVLAEAWLDDHLTVEHGLVAC